MHCITWPVNRVIKNNHTFGIPIPYLPIHYTVSWVYNDYELFTCSFTSRWFSAEERNIMSMTLDILTLVSGRAWPLTWWAPLPSFKILHLSLLWVMIHFEPLRMHKFTWPVGWGPKAVTYCESPTPICLITVGLSWGLHWWLRVIYLHMSFSNVKAIFVQQFLSLIKIFPTRSPAVTEGPRERAVSWKRVKYCVNVRRIALEKAYNRGMNFKVIQGH